MFEASHSQLTLALWICCALDDLCSVQRYSARTHPLHCRAVELRLDLLAHTRSMHRYYSISSLSEANQLLLAFDVRSISILREASQLTHALYTVILSTSTLRNANRLRLYLGLHCCAFVWCSA
jgi:hypothetical protein